MPWALNVVAAILNGANQSRISEFPIFTLINLFHHHPLNLAYTRFCPFYRSSPISLGHPHPQLREASAVARSLATVIVHVGACLKLYLVS